MDGVRADVQSGGHFLFRESFHQQTKDPEMGPRQPDGPGRLQTPFSMDRQFQHMRYQFASRIHVKKVMDLLEVGMNGVRADVQSGGHFLFRVPFQQQTKDPEMGPRQPERLRCLPFHDRINRYYR